MKASAGFLAKIAELTRARVAAARLRDSEESLIESFSHQPCDFAARIRLGSGLIAEIKRASPSRGSIALDLDPVQVAADYLANGASAISILTEPSYFGGTVDDLRRVRRAFPTAALLMKDFVVDVYQLSLARAIGADAVLLIVAMLSGEELSAFYERALELSLTVLVEVHNEEEMESALNLGASLVGVNNRDLKSLQTDLAVSRSMAKYAHPDRCLISESGIQSAEDLADLKALGFNGFLVGTALMENHTPAESLRQMVRS